MNLKLSFLLVFLLLLNGSFAIQMITDCIGLQNMQNNLTANYVLANDIDCSATVNWNAGAGFVPIGNSSIPFTGTLNGGSYTIYNVTIYRPSTNYVGLFGIVSGATANIMQVGLKGATIQGLSNVGGLVGWNYFGSISNSHATGNISVSGTNTNLNIGGLVGSNSGTISNSYATGHATGSVSESGTNTHLNIGGLVGSNSGLISNSYATSWATGSVSESGTNAFTYVDVGGLVGSNSGTISNCYATGHATVSGSGSGAGTYRTYAGGLVGDNSGTISSSYATGQATGSVLESGIGTAYTYAGGLAGSNSGTTSNCYAIGNTMGSGIATSSYAYAIVGGLAGSNTGTISNCYATGQATNGLVSANGGGGTVISSYWDVQTSSQTTSAAGIGLITAAMQQPTSFAGWDFTTAWAINPGVTYPLLQAFIVPPVLSNPLSNITLYIGTLFVFTLPANVFTDPNGLRLAYTTELVDGSPLPAWLAFKPSTQTFVGTPLSGTQGILMMEVSAYNLPTESTSDLFQLTILNRSPIINAPFTQQVAFNKQPFQFIVPDATFFDADGDRLQLSATTNQNMPLPGWLGFNAALGIFSGTATQRGNQWINVTASDGFGGQVSALLQITTPNTAPKTTAAFPNQVLVVAQSFSFTIPANIFSDLDGDPLIYSASLFGGATLLPWIIFNAQTLTFQGVPNAVGFLMISVVATDTYNATASLDFGVSVSDLGGNSPPLLAIQVLDQTATVTQLFTLTLPNNMFVDPDGDPLTYRATLEGGAPLPSWLNFSATSFAFSGVPTATGSFHITVRVDDGRGGFSLDTFTLTVTSNQQLPPFVQNPLSNQVVSVGGHFQFTVPSNTFIDVNNAPLTYAATTSGNGPLPHWLHFDANTRTFAGTPSDTDTNLYAPRITVIDVRASNGIGSAVNTFQLSVTGTSQGEKIINALITLASIVSTAFALYRNRAFLWNTFLKKKYEKEPKQVALNEPFTYQFKVPSEKILYVKAFDKAPPLFAHTKCNGCLKYIPFNRYQKLLDGSNLPAWLDFNRKTMTLSGTAKESTDLYICAEGFDGRYLEAFKLRCGEPQSKDVEMQNI